MTATKLTSPLHADLEELLALESRVDGTILAIAYKKPFGKSFGQMVSAAIREAGFLRAVKRTVFGRSWQSCVPRWRLLAPLRNIRTTPISTRRWDADYALWQWRIGVASRALAG